MAFFTRLEASRDVISGDAIEHVGLDVHVKFGDPRFNRSRDIRVAQFVMDNDDDDDDTGVSRSLHKAKTRFALKCSCYNGCQNELVDHSIVFQVLNRCVSSTLVVAGLF